MNAKCEIDVPKKIYLVQKCKNLSLESRGDCSVALFRESFTISEIRSFLFIFSRILLKEIFSQRGRLLL